MGILDNKVVRITLYKKGIIYNRNHQKFYPLRRYGEIEFFDGRTIKLDMDADEDITECEHLQIVNKGILVKTIFESWLKKEHE